MQKNRLNSGSSSSLFRAIVSIGAVAVFYHSELYSQGLYVDFLSRNIVQIEAGISTGSGVVVVDDEHLFVITNRHIVEGSYRFIINALDDVNEPAKSAFVAELYAFSPDYDFAILEITEKTDRSYFNPRDYICQRPSSRVCFTELPFDELRGLVKRGDTIGLLGFPSIGDNKLIYTTGIISSLKYELYNGTRTLVWIRTDAAMSPGNSGGLAFNRDGIPLGLPTYVSRESRTGGRLGNILSFDLIFSVIDSGEMIRIWDQFDEQQVRLDTSLEPHYGEISLVANFTPNLHQIQVVAGGSNPVTAVGDDCVGFAATRPDYRVHWSGWSEELYFLFLADDESDDATLVINTPDGRWHCNDDAYDGTLNPAIVFERPRSGQYDIWVGSYHEGEYISGNLYITQNLDDTEEPETVNWRLSPHYGSRSLSAGFLPDPFTISMTAGGSIDVKRSGTGRECIGFAAEAPDFRLHWTGEGRRLIVSFVADENNDDTTLIINTPDGRWHCNDDAHAGTLNPQITFSSAQDGQYDIWVGAYHEGELIRGRLYISEIDEYVP